MTTSPFSDPKDACGPQTSSEWREYSDRMAIAAEEWRLASLGRPPRVMGIQPESWEEHERLTRETETFFDELNGGDDESVI